MTTYTSSAQTIVVSVSSTAGAVPDSYTYPLNTAYVRVVRPISDVIDRSKAAVRDTSNSRWSDAEIIHAINRSLDDWSGRVYIPCVYDTPDNLEWDAIHYSMPYYVRTPVTLQRKVERWVWSQAQNEDNWSDVQGVYMTSDGLGSQHLNVDAGSQWLTDTDLRVLWYAEVGHVPVEDVYLFSSITGDASEAVISGYHAHTVGDVGFVKIGNEIIQYSGVQENGGNTTLQGLLRGTNNTLVDSHAANDKVEWCIPYVDSALYTVLISQIQSYLHEYFMTDASARETEHHQWMMRWHQQKADDFWTTWLPNRRASVNLSRQAINSREY